MRLVRNSEDRNPAGTTGGLLGDRSKAYDPTAFGGTATLVYDEQRRRLVEDFVSLNGTTVNCAGGISYRRRYWLTGEETVGGPRRRPIPPRASPSATATCSRPRWTAGRTSSRSACRSRPRAASRTRPRRSTSARASSTRPRTRAPASARASTATRRSDPDDLAAGGVLEMLAIDGQPQVDLREGQRRGRPLPVQWVRIEDPDPDAGSRRRPARARSTRAGRRAARSSTASRAAGRTTARSSSSPPAAATSRTATSTPTATRRASARSGPTGPSRHGAAGRSRSSSSPSRAPSATRRTT